MNPQNSRAFVPKFYGCRMQLIALITLLTSLTVSAGARDFRNASERTRWYPLGLTISPTTLPNGSTSVFYRAYLRARGGAGRYQFSRVGGDMPQGLSLRSNGAITGTPQNAGSFSFRVLVTDLPRRDRGEATISVYIADGSENWNSPISVSVSPLGPTVPSGGTQQFEATVSNTTNTAVAWSSSHGTISSSGMFTAPMVTAATNVMVRATSMADSTKSAATSVIVTPAPSPVTPIVVSVSPASAHVGAGATQQFSATVSNTSNNAVTWSASNGTISPSGMFTAPSAASSSNVTVTAASVADPSKSAQASVSVDALPAAAVSISINPTSANLTSGGTQQFSATVSNSSNTAVTWSASNGTISQSGMFTAPSVASTTNVTVMATSVADPSKTAQASVSINPPAAVTISINPTSATIGSGATQQFSATVSNTSNTAVTWSASNGTISQSGMFTAPSVGSATNVTVTATSVADSTQSAQASVTVIPPITPPSGGGSADNIYCGPGNVPNFGSNDGPAQLPQTCIYTARSGTPSPGNITFVPSGGNILGVLNAANCGDVIQLQAGGTFTAVNPLPAKGCDDNHWITIETSGISSLPPEGTRITPCYAGVASLPGRPAYSCSNPQNVMAKIVQTQGSGSGPAVDFANGANHYRFIGVEITRSPGIGYVSILIDLETSSKIIFDQVWAHGVADNLGDETNAAVYLNGSDHAAIIDSYFNDFYCISGIGSCTDAKVIGGAIGSSGTWGTYKIVNNFMEAAGQSFLEGGGPATGTPADYEFRRNHLFKPLTWNPNHPSYDGGVRGTPLNVKNLFELKNANRVLVEGNVMENSWGGFSQSGPGILLTPANQSGQAPLANVRHVTIRYNIIRNTAQPFQIASVDQDPACPGGCVNAGESNFSIHDDVVDHIQWPYCGGGACSNYVNEILNANDLPAGHQLHDLTINHITEVLDNHVGVSAGFAAGPNASSGAQMYNFTWKNSIIPAGEYGFNNGGAGTADCGFGVAASTPVITACFAGTVVFGNNLIPWGNGQNWTPLGGGGGPQSVADQNAVGYANLSGGNYQLTSASPGHNAADDGTDIGADINAVNTYTQGVQ